ncbi:sugar 3,4-ketoisomerase [Nocardiopsis sp. CNT-189]|uniref:sugar 3,4-ketoisomerase n=1 Tax=Nocardiopsis oceanisediminis TaxID=2816862 RepID=UPI003B3AE6E6
MNVAETGVGAARTIDLQTFADPRGRLSVVEGGRHVPFEIRRVYYLYGVPDDALRGAHGHRRLRQLVVAVHGGFTVHLDDGFRRCAVTLDRPDQGLYIAPMTWREIIGFTGGAVAMVLASDHYDAGDYFHDYERFLLEARAAAPPPEGGRV